MNKQLLLTMLAVLFVFFSASSVCASEISVADSYDAGLVDDASDLSVYDVASLDVSALEDSNVANDSFKFYLSSGEVLESEASNILSTNTDLINANEQTVNSTNYINNVIVADNDLLGAGTAKKDVYFVAPNRTINIDEISGGYSYPVVLKDIDGHNLANKQVALYFNGEKYIATTNNNGWAYFNISTKKTGNYKVSLKTAGDKLYNSLSSYSITTVKVTGVDVYFVAPNRTVMIDEISKGYSYPVVLKDIDGHNLANKQVNLYFNGEKYTATTDSKGWAYFDIIAKKTGNYKITLKFANDGYYNSLSSYGITTVKVLGVGVNFVAPNRTLRVDEISKGYSYPVILKDVNGKVLANKQVALYFNGEKYTATTDSKGWAYFNITADKIGNYKTTLKFAGDGYYNSLSRYSITTVKVLGVDVCFVALDLTLDVDEISKGYTYPVLLKDVDGNILANKKVTINFNGKKQTKTTDDLGIAYFDITANKKGNYAVDIAFAGDEYYNSLSCNNFKNIQVLEYETAINWMSENSFKSGSQTFKVLLTDVDGAALANKVVKLIVNSKTYSAKTASNGYATFKLNLNPDTYYAVYSFEGDGKFVPSSGFAEVTVVSPSVSINDILVGSTYIKNYYANNKVLPSTVTVGSNTFNMPQFFYLMSQAICRLENSNTGSVNVNVGVKAPQSECAEAVYSAAVTEDRYVAIAKNLVSYMDQNKEVPNHVVDVAGKIAYDDYMVMSARILAYYYNNKELPNFVSFISSREPYLNITPESSAGNPYGLNGKKVWIDADGGSDAIKWELANALKKLGWDVHVGDTYANAHYEDYHNVYPGYVLINIYNGFCAGTMRELASSSIQDLLDAKHVVCVPVFHTAGWTNPQGMAPYRYGDFSGYSAQRAWDDDFSTMDPAIDNVEKFFKVNDIKYCASPTCQLIINQFLSGGYFEYVS